MASAESGRYLCIHVSATRGHKKKRSRKRLRDGRSRRQVDRSMCVCARARNGRRPSRHKKRCPLHSLACTAQARGLPVRRCCSEFILLSIYVRTDILPRVCVRVSVAYKLKYNCEMHADLSSLWCRHATPRVILCGTMET